jgi:hypothetical protein
VKRPCKAPGCTGISTVYGAYCSTHKSTNRRHGAPDQRGVTKSDLKPYRMLIEGRIRENGSKEVWGLLDQRWTDLVSHARATEKATVSGWSRRASQELQKLGLAVAPREIIVTVLAMYLIQDQEARRFKSDRAFETQLVRRVRGLTELNATVSTLGNATRATRAYTELPPRVTTIIAQLIISTLGQAGVWIAQRENAEAKRKDRSREMFAQCLSEVSFL